MTQLNMIHDKGLSDEEILKRHVEQHVLVTTPKNIFDYIINWGKKSSIWPMQFGLACCAIEMICAASSRYDIARFGAELFRPSPRQADLMIVSGTVTKRMVPMIVRLYNQMAAPKYVMSMGACATAGGPFKEGYNVVSGIDEFIPVDIYITGCPPTPQALLEGLIELQKKINNESYKIAPWYQKDYSDMRSVPKLGPDLVDPRQVSDIKKSLLEDKPVESPEITLPPYVPAFEIYKPEPPEEEAPPEEVAEGEKPKKKPKKKKKIEPPTVTPVMQNILEKFPDVQVTITGSLVVPAEQLVSVAIKLRDQESHNYLANLTSSDYEDCFEVVYHFCSIEGGSPITIVVRTDKENPSVPSLTPIWAGADFQEREVYDMMGIRFEGHPNLKRILMWDGFEGFPLRKDYLEPYYEEPHKIFGSRWRNGVHTLSEDKNMWGRNVRYPDSWDPETSSYDDDDPELAAMSPNKNIQTELVEVNMGPQHPSTHGVFRMKLALDGENIIQLKPIMGYLHRNHEKIGERNSYLMNFPYTDRLDYITSMSNNHGYAIAVEKLLGLEVPERAEYLRVIMCELTRVVSHLWSMGFLINDMGAFFTPMLYALQERELVLDLFEMVSGSRMMCNYMRFGGVAHDLTPEFYPTAEHLINERLPRLVDELNKYLTTNEIVMERSQNIGVITKEEAIAYSTSGPILRGSGVNYDVRKHDPYSIYDRFDFNVVTQEAGDVYARYLVRLGEVYESLNILKQAMKDLPEGDIIAKKQWNVIVPAGESYGRVESPKGELSYYIVSEKGSNPYRYHVRSPSFINLTCLEKMCQGHMVADAVVILGSLDIVLGEVDR